MSRACLRITYRKGKALAAYLQLPRRPDDSSSRVEATAEGFLIDWTVDGRPIGIEMPSRSTFSPIELNNLLARLKLEPMGLGELWPLVVAVDPPANPALVG